VIQPKKEVPIEAEVDADEFDGFLDDFIAEKQGTALVQGHQEIY
jgi:hypothetical protein